MAQRFAFGVLLLSGLIGCSHSTETVVHLSASSGGAWSVRDHEGARLCALPCRVELEPNQAVVVARDSGGQAFVVHQESLGRGAWNGSIRTQREPSPSAVAVQRFSGTLVNAGTNLAESESEGRRKGRVAAGIVLAGLGTIGLLASAAIPDKTREELFLERMAATP